MKINKLIFIFFLYMSFSLQANVNININKVTTNRGFKCLFVRNCNLPKVSLNISFKDAGYAYEDTEKQGLSWFTSLIIQEGAGKNDAKDFAKRLEDKGINLDFVSCLEEFKISLSTLSENLEDGISLLSDAILSPKIDSKGLNRIFDKTKVIFNNLKKDPYFVAEEELKKLLFKKHSYSKNRYGTLDTIMSITKDDVLSYIKRNFAKNNIVISVVGCTTKEEIHRLLDKYLSDLPEERTKVKKLPIKNSFGPSEYKNIIMDIPHSIISFAQRGVWYKDQDYYNASILINALGGIGLRSILMKELRKNIGITYDVSASIVPRKYGSTITGLMSTDSSTANKAILVIKDIFSTVKKEGIDEQLLNDTKATLINNFTFLLSNNINIAVLLDDIQMNYRDINHINNYPNIINSVKLEDINKLASSLLDPENLFFIEIGRELQKK